MPRKLREVKGLKNRKKVKEADKTFARNVAGYKTVTGYKRGKNAERIPINEIIGRLSEKERQDLKKRELTPKEKGLFHIRMEEIEDFLAAGRRRETGREIQKLMENPESGLGALKMEEKGLFLKNGKGFPRKEDIAFGELRRSMLTQARKGEIEKRNIREWREVARFQGIPEKAFLGLLEKSLANVPAARRKQILKAAKEMP